MKRIMLALLLISLGNCCLFARAQTPSAPVTTQTASVRALLSEANSRAALSGFAPLRTTVLSPDDVEVRFWERSDTSLKRGYVLRRRSGVWSADLLPTPQPWLEIFDFRFHLDKQPDGGWNKIWRRLQEHEILTLPDQGQTTPAQIPAQSAKKDTYRDPVTTYLVEVSANGVNRAYSYAHLERFDDHADEQMTVIARTIDQALDLGAIFWKAESDGIAPLPAEAERHLLGDSFTESGKVDTIPSWVGQWLTEGNRGYPLPMANADEEFQRGDVVTKPGLPLSRLNFVATSGDYCVLSFDSGGWGGGRSLLLYHRLSSGPFPFEIYSANLMGYYKPLNLAEVRAMQVKRGIFRVRPGYFGGL